MESKKIIEAADSLYNAQNTGVPVEPLSSRYPDITTEDAYQVQNRITDMRIGQGRRIAGRKIGLTSQAMMEMFKVDEPDYGVLFDDQIFSNNCFLDRSKMIQPRIEAEIACLVSNPPGADPHSKLKL